MGRALAHRNFRLYAIGQAISWTGSWMQQVATIWLVYRLNSSPFLLGLAVFASQVPAALVTPLAGVLTDRWNRRRTVFTTQALAMLQAIALMGLTAAGMITIWQVVLLNVLLGVVTAFDMPARQSFLIEMVERREDLANGIAINSSIYNAARLIGPGIAGFLIGLLGEWPCFLLNGLSYLAVLGSLALMRVKPVLRAVPEGGIVAGLKEAMNYVAGSPPILAVLVLLGVVSMLTMPLTVLLPLVVTDILSGGADTLGMLTAASGIGALAASLFLASRRSVLGLGRLIALSTAALGLGMIGLALTDSFTTWAAVMLVTGFALVAQGATSNTVLQTVSDEDKLGRVMSFYAMAFTGMAPLGSLLAGSLAARVGTRAAFVVCGGGCTLGAAIFAVLLPSLRKHVLPIYLRIGILRADSAQVTGIEPASDPPQTIPLPATRRRAA